MHEYNTCAMIATKENSSVPMDFQRHVKRRFIKSNRPTIGQLALIRRVGRWRV